MEPARLAINGQTNGQPIRRFGHLWTQLKKILEMVVQFFALRCIVGNADEEIFLNY